MKMTAGPARVIRASAAKLAIRWKSSPMERKQMSGMLPNAGYEGFPLLVQHELNLCDGLSQPKAADQGLEVVS